MHNLVFPEYPMCDTHCKFYAHLRASINNAHFPPFFLGAICEPHISQKRKRGKSKPPCSDVFGVAFSFLFLLLACYLLISPGCTIPFKTIDCLEGWTRQVRGIIVSHCDLHCNAVNPMAKSNQTQLKYLLTLRVITLYIHAHGYKGALPGLGQLHKDNVEKNFLCIAASSQEQ